MGHHDGGEPGGGRRAWRRLGEELCRPQDAQSQREGRGAGRVDSSCQRVLDVLRESLERLRALLRGGRHRRRSAQVRRRAALELHRLLVQEPELALRGAAAPSEHAAADDAEPRRYLARGVREGHGGGHRRVREEQKAKQREIGGVPQHVPAAVYGRKLHDPIARGALEEQRLLRWTAGRAGVQPAEQLGGH